MVQQATARIYRLPPTNTNRSKFSLKQKIGWNYAWRMRYFLGTIHILEETQSTYGFSTKAARLELDSVRTKMREKFILQKARKI